MKNKNVVDIVVSQMPDILTTEIGNMIGHFIKIDEKEYFVSPRLPHLKIFEISGSVAMFLTDMEATDDVLHKTSSLVGFINYLYDDVVPFLLDMGG